MRIKSVPVRWEVVSLMFLAGSLLLPLATAQPPSPGLTAAQEVLLKEHVYGGLPNASYIGFTGRPLFKDDEITRRVFGDYISTYDFQRAVDDKATVPLYYDARGDKLGVAVGDLNERIAEKLEELETDDIDVEQRLEQESTNVDNTYQPHLRGSLVRPSYPG